MKSIFTPVSRVMAASAMLLAVQSGVAHATAGDVISNTVTVNFEVNSQAQTAVTDSVDFTVDEMVDFLVADGHGGAINNQPGQTQTLSFQIDNDGNKDRDFNLAVVFTGSGLTAAAVGTAAGSLAEGEYAISASNVSIGESGDTTVTVSYRVPNTVANGTSYDFRVTAVAADGTTPLVETGTSDIDTEEIVFADGDADPSGSDDAAQNNFFFDTVTVTVQSATVSATKAVAVLDDGRTGSYACATIPTNGTPAAGNGDNPIPGACIEYTITVDNTGPIDASSVQITDNVAGDVDVVAVSYLADGATNYVAGSFTDQSVDTNVGTIGATTGQAILLIRGVLQ
ncbi:MAG: hypothetical protein AAFQ73_06330 [Pseudomonadota bacterium]